MEPTRQPTVPEIALAKALEDVRYWTEIIRRMRELASIHG